MPELWALFWPLVTHQHVQQPAELTVLMNKQLPKLIAFEDRVVEHNFYGVEAPLILDDITDSTHIFAMSVWGPFVPT